MDENTLYGKNNNHLHTFQIENGIWTERNSDGRKVHIYNRDDHNPLTDMADFWRGDYEVVVNSGYPYKNRMRYYPDQTS
jgi:hypothetical protein